MIRTALIAAVGWTGIIALGWWLADRRLRCLYNCKTELTEARDNWLLLGLTVALIAGCVVSFLLSRRGRFSRLDADPAPRSANRAARSRLLR